MMGVSRRHFLLGAGALGVSGCAGSYDIPDLRRNGLYTYDDGYEARSSEPYDSYQEPETYYDDYQDPYADQAPSAVDPSFLQKRTIPYSGNAPYGSILINTDMRKLYFVEGNTATEYPIAVGREGKDVYNSRYYIAKKVINPSWTPTAEMRANNDNLPQTVPGGTPENPLGTRAIYFNNMNGTDSLLRAHGNNAPSSIGKAVSSGCFRMFNSHVEELYRKVIVGRPVFTYSDQPFTPGIENNSPTALGWQLRP